MSGDLSADWWCVRPDPETTLQKKVVSVARGVKDGFIACIEAGDNDEGKVMGDKSVRITIHAGQALCKRQDSEKIQSRTICGLLGHFDWTYGAIAGLAQGNIDRPLEMDEHLLLMVVERCAEIDWHRLTCFLVCSLVRNAIM